MHTWLREREKSRAATLPALRFSLSFYPNVVLFLIFPSPLLPIHCFDTRTYAIWYHQYGTAVEPPMPVNGCSGTIIYGVMVPVALATSASFAHPSFLAILYQKVGYLSHSFVIQTLITINHVKPKADFLTS